jgi:hypothetical protein
MIPYFVNGTISQIMNFENNGLPAIPGTDLKMGLRMWTNTDQTDLARSLFTRQQVSSRFGQKGLNYFRSANGMDHSCAFDYRCMQQPEFIADGKTCSVNDQCQPNLASGYDVGVIPGRFFGSEYGTEDFHGIGKSKTLFVSDMFMQANFTQVDTDAAWGNVVVDKWNLANVGMRTEKCDSSNPLDRGIDCSSPAGTINIGYNAAYSAGMTPLSGVLPLYASFPHFQEVTPDNPRINTYNPLDKLRIHSCDSCPEERDFDTFLWTEPQTGAHVKGSQKIQLNVRISASAASTTIFPGSTDTILTDGSVIINENTDVVIPIYWIDKYDTAADYQKDTIAFVQNVPYYISIVFWAGLWVGILFLGVGGFLLWKGLVMRKAGRAVSRVELAKAAEEGEVVAREVTETNQ